jgi:Fe-S cluster assembly iron-binding protein IscA
LNVRVSDIIGDDSPHRAAAVNLTPRAAQAALELMAGQGFPPGSGIRIEVTGKHRPRTYEITYDDVPQKSDRDWITESNGVTILVFKQDAALVDGLTIDFQKGAYVFDARMTSS